MIGSRFLRGALLSICTVIVAMFVASKLQTSAWNGQQAVDLVDRGLYVDGWLKDQSTLTIEGFSTVANKLKLTFNPLWLIPNEAPRVAVSLCNGPISELTIKDATPNYFSIPTGCSPLVVKITALNSFSLLEGRSTRMVGAQLLNVAVSSPLRFAIVSFPQFLKIFSAVGLLVILALCAVGRDRRLSTIAVLGVLATTTVIVKLSDVQAHKFEPLWIVFAALLAGTALLPVASRQDQVQRSASKIWLYAIVVFGAFLRFYSIDFGLPANFHPDEVPKVNAIMRMVEQNSWNPQYFLHPSLLLYTTYMMNCVLQAIGVEGSFRETAFLAGRFVSSIAGTLSIALTYEVGRRLISRNVGLLAAGLLAILPLHVTCSRYLKEDALLTFLVLSCVVTTLIAVQSKRRWMLVLAGVLAGFTAGTKYSGILLAVVPASAPWIASRDWKPDWKWVPWALAALAIAPIGFLCTTPFALLDYAKFIKDFGVESRHMQTGHTNSIDAWSQLWMYHFSRSIWVGMTPILAVGSVIGLGYLLRRRRIEDLLLVGLVLLFYLPAEFVKAKPAPQPERYIMPCLPFLAIALAQVIRALGRTISPKYGVALFATALLAAPLYRTVALANDVGSDTRDQLALWMRDNLPAGTKVLMDWKPYCPRLDGDHFAVEHIPRARIISELDPKLLRDSGADYMVLSSLFYARYFNQPESNPVLRQRIKDVFDSVPVVAQYAAPAGTYGFHNPVLTLFSLKKEDFERLDGERKRKRLGELAQTSNDMRAQRKW